MGSKWTNIAIVGGILLLALIVAFLGYGKNKDVDEALGSREKMDKDLATVRPQGDAGHINEKDIDRANERREKIEEERSGILNQAIKWNDRNYTVPQLRMLDNTVRPALPYSEDAYKRNELPTRFAEAYHAQIEKMLQELNPTWLPSQDLIDEEALRQQKTLDKLSAVATKGAKAGATSRVRMPAGMPPDMPPMMDPYGEFRGMPSQPRRSRDTRVQVSQEAMQRAEDVLRLRQAQVGEIYATKDSFYQAIAPGPLPKLSPGDLWDAWVSLCVQRDLVTAIRATNQEVFEKTPDARPTVVRAPIKRLARIYVEPRPIAETTTTDGPMDMGFDGYGPPPEVLMAMGGGPQGQTGPVASTDTLTDRETSQMYEVVRYEITVLMPTRYLPLFQKNLLKQNYHTVLNQNVYPTLEEAMQAVSTTARPGRTGRVSNPMSMMSGRTGRDREGEGDGMFYYGTEPYRAVTIRGELLLLSDWTRGTFDEASETWTRPPLMPKAVVEQLPVAARRPTDVSRLDGSIPEWTPKVAEPAEPTETPTPNEEPVEQTPADATSSAEDA